MKLAIEQVQIAGENGDVPIGAVIVFENQIIGRAYNQRQQLSDPTAHAESRRLHGCTIYVTIGPCPPTSVLGLAGPEFRPVYLR